jgi:hypothetical protein
MVWLLRAVHAEDLKIAKIYEWKSYVRYVGKLQIYECLEKPECSIRMLNCPIDNDG